MKPFLWDKPDPVPEPPDIGCPECGWPDGVPTRQITRTKLKGGNAVSREVGTVKRCTRCMTEYAVGFGGAYLLGTQGLRKHAQGAAETPAQTRHRTQLRDSDQPWDEGG